MKKFFILLFVLTFTTVTSYAQPEDAKYVKVYVTKGLKAIALGYRVYCEGLTTWAEKIDINGWDKRRCIGVKNDVFSLGFIYPNNKMFDPNYDKTTDTVYYPYFYKDLHFWNYSDDKVLIEWRDSKFTGRDYPVSGLTAHQEADILYGNKTIPTFAPKVFYKPYNETGELQIIRREVPFYIIHDGKTHTYNIVFEFAYPWKMIDSKDKIE